MFSDVDIVVRIGCPSTMEQLVQELGRAGRDGRPCEGKTSNYNCDYCYLWSVHSVKYDILTILIHLGVLFYREQDLQHTAFWSKSTPEEELLPAFSSAWR